jgi:hypothetical protein
MSWRWVLYPSFDSDEWPPQASEEEIEKADRERAVLYDELLTYWTNWKGWTEWRTARKALMEAEVAVARQRGEEYAVLLDMGAALLKG